MSGSWGTGASRVMAALVSKMQAHACLPWSQGVGPWVSPQSLPPGPGRAECSRGSRVRGSGAVAAQPVDGRSKSQAPRGSGGPAAARPW